MLVLAVESAGPRPGVALATEKGLLDEALVEAGSTPGSHDDSLRRPRSEAKGTRPGKHLVPLLELLLRRRGLSIEALDLYAVDVGPGSFTGIRVGLASVKALALVHPRPAMAVSSLEAMAWSCPSESEDVVPVIHSHRDLFYIARFGWEAGRIERRLRDTLVRGPDLASAIGGGGRVVRFIGPGLARITSDIRTALGMVGRIDPADGERVPSVSIVAAIAIERFHMGLGVAPQSLQPVYLQSPY